MSLALLMSAVAQAQTTHLKITVPFDFVAGTSSSLPPNMKSRPSDLGGTTLSVHNVNSDAVTLVLSISCRSQKPGVNAKLVSIVTATVFPSRSVESEQRLRQPDKD